MGALMAFVLLMIHDESLFWVLQSYNFIQGIENSLATLDLVMFYQGTEFWCGLWVNLLDMRTHVLDSIFHKVFGRRDQMLLACKHYVLEMVLIDGIDFFSQHHLLAGFDQHF